MFRGAGSLPVEQKSRPVTASSGQTLYTHTLFTHLVACNVILWFVFTELKTEDSSSQTLQHQLSLLGSSRGYSLSSRYTLCTG